MPPGSAEVARIRHYGFFAEKFGVPSVVRTSGVSCADYDDAQLATIQSFLARAAQAGRESAERLVP